MQMFEELFKIFVLQNL